MKTTTVPSFCIARKALFSGRTTRNVVRPELHGEVPRSPAFTLIELLTVVAIIGVLAGILIPVLGKVRSTARNATCIANLRQLGQGFQLYINDNKGCLPVAERPSPPPATNWVYALIGYDNSGPDYIGARRRGVQLPTIQTGAKTVLLCETSVKTVSDPASNSSATTYSINIAASNGTTGGRNSNEFDAPSRFCLLGEPKVKNGTSFNKLMAGNDPNAILDPTIHGNHSNVLYLDGHVGSIREVPDITTEDGKRFWKP
jgi:general secretion pathway protein G